MPVRARLSICADLGNTVIGKDDTERAPAERSTVSDQDIVAGCGCSTAGTISPEGPLKA